MTPIVFSALAFFAPLSSEPIRAAPDVAPIATRIEEVTVYGTSALVRRVGAVEHGGSYLVRGLPNALDPDGVRVRCSAGDVVRVEVKERLEASVPSERVQGLRDRLAAAQRELAALQDEDATNTMLREGFGELVKLDAANHARDVAQGAGDPEEWRASLRTIAERLAELARAQREIGWRIEDQRRAMQAIEAELGRAQSAPTVRTFDVAVELAAAGRTDVELEYLVGRAGWTPAYDVRASRDLASVALGYRARVRQSTGEDWSDVVLVLSTSRPQRGAEGPEPVTTWVDVVRPARRGSSGGIPASEAPLQGAGYLGEEARKRAGDDATRKDEQRPFATVEDLGLAARFQLAKRVTIESRDEATTVLVGEASLPIVAERWCTPSLDPTVWLRAKTKNASPWTMLPGVAAVFLGADYVGSASIGAVQPGQELVLHLGADPAIAVTRTQVQDLSKGPAFLSSRASKVEAWRTRFENHGASAVDVIVREAVPKTKDDRIEIELTKAAPPYSSDERWKQDREEKGIHTWVLAVPRGGATELVVQTTIRFPKDETLVATGGDR